MRDLTTPDVLVRFWVATGDVAKLRALLVVHSPGRDGACRGCRSRTTDCMFRWSAEQALIQLGLVP